MNTNIGRLDKTLRLLLAIIIVLVAVYYNTSLGAIAVVPLLTGAVSFCPIYSLFGINTNPGNKKQA